MTGVSWVFFKYCGLSVVAGFIIGTAIAHIVIYARKYGKNSPIRGVSPVMMIILIILMIGVTNFFDGVVPYVGELYAVLIGLGSQIVGFIVGYTLRKSMGIGPPPM